MAKHVLALWVAFCVLGAGTAYAVWRTTQQNDALSAVICHAENVVRKSPGITKKQRHQAIHFYEQQITLEHLKPCQN